MSTLSVGLTTMRWQHTVIVQNSMVNRVTQAMSTNSKTLSTGGATGRMGTMEMAPQGQAATLIPVAEGRETRYYVEFSHRREAANSLLEYSVKIEKSHSEGVCQSWCRSLTT